MSQPPSQRATVKRKPQRGVYDRAAINAILDEGLICHVGFSAGGQTFVLPTIHVRVGDKVYLHGSPHPPADCSRLWLREPKRV